mgnify:FL=1
MGWDRNDHHTFGRNNMIRIGISDAKALEALLTALLEDVGYNEFRGGQLRDFIPVLIRVRTELRSQLADYRSGSKGQVELVDRIANILQRRGPGNYLNGSVLANMRTAILNPSELFKMEHRPQRLCPRCETPIVVGVMTCIGDSDENLFCMQCVKPSWCTCSVCRAPVGIAGTTLKKISGITCTQCAAGKSKVVEAQQDGADPGILTTLDQLEHTPLPPFAWPTRPERLTGVRVRRALEPVQPGRYARSRGDVVRFDPVPPPPPAEDTQR